jgi:SAM-dependent methyltransferase
MSDERWLAAIWPLVRSHLPAAPARVVDLGCGPLGGFVPLMRSSGYDAVGIDPEAPDEQHYERIEFERAEIPERVDAVVASTSLHHVANPAEVLDRIRAVVKNGGVLVVEEWAWERFDKATATWSFERLGRGDEEGWLRRRRDEWLASGDEWSEYFKNWAEQEGLHPGEQLVRLLDERFRRHHLANGPYLFADLANTTASDEQAAIDTGQISAMRIDWVGVLR